MKRILFLSVISLGIIFISLWLPGCDELITEQITDTIFANPDADFDVTPPDSGCVPFTANFFDLTKGAPTRWVWDFGDGDSSKDTNPTHIYDSAGTYTVTLKVFDDPRKTSDVMVKKRFIVVGQSIADFTVDIDSGCPGTEVTFTPLQYGGISSWKWNFGDGKPLGTDSIVTHIYDTAGLYTVTLTVNGDCGQTILSDTDLIKITECPVVNFFSSDSVGCVPMVVDFFDSSIAGSNQIITSRFWKFGDGQTSTNPDPTHQYDAAGIYTVTLQVTGTGGVSIDSIVDFITVYDSAEANFNTILPSPACSSFSQYVVKFEDQSKGNVTDWSWDFGDGLGSNDTNPIHVYTKSGQYDVRLFVNSTCGIDDTLMQKLVTLYGLLPPVNFSVNKDTFSIAADTSLVFNDLSSGLAATILWNFGDSTTAVTPQAVHAYADTGKYVVTLTRSNDCNTVVAEDTIIVIP